ncbi:hypothetical protein BASA81_002389 [Batrachochytrium salamandrivorans]|nr:hypothetical protein BASA81_002389 [Batrachochytrium salamandrivorans]
MQPQVVIRCDFPDTGKYHAKYQRNNKRTGLKNLRCFPFCGPEDKHHENGFCGGAVKVNVFSASPSPHYQVDRLVAFGEFTQNAHGGLARFPPGSMFSQHDVNKILRSDGEHLNPLFESSSNDSAFPHFRQFSFESQKKGWHYDWKGNKYTSDLPHCFTVYVAVPMDDALGHFHCLGVFSSPEFTMFCRRRHKTVPEAEKTLMATPVSDFLLQVAHPVGLTGRIDISPPNPAAATGSSSSPLSIIAAPPPPPPVALVAATVKKKRSVANESPGGKRTKANSLLPPPPPPLTAMALLPPLPPTFFPTPPSSLPSTPVFGLTPVYDATPLLPSNATTAVSSSSVTLGDVKLRMILAAIQNLDSLRKKVSAGETTEATPNVPTPGGEEETDDLFFETPLDANWFGTFFSGAFRDQGLLDFTSSVRDMAATDGFLVALGEGQNLVETVRVIEALGMHLVDEDTFTETIHQAAKTTSMTFADCMLMLNKEIQSFLRFEFNMTVDDLYNNLNGGPSSMVDFNADTQNKQAMESAFGALVQAAIQNNHSPSPSASSSSTSPAATPLSSTATATATALASVSTPLPDTAFDIQFPPNVCLEDFLGEPFLNTNFAHFPDVTGNWIRPEANILDMERWRERRDMDWASRQMLAKMESKFGMASQPLTNSVAVALSKKLLSNGALTYQLDGIERPFPMHGPFGSAVAKTMVGWAIGPCVVFRNGYSDTERLIRANWKVGEDELHGVHIYQFKGDSGFRHATMEFATTADGWKVAHIAKYICTRDLSRE